MEARGQSGDRPRVLILSELADVGAAQKLGKADADARSSAAHTTSTSRMSRPGRALLFTQVNRGTCAPAQLGMRQVRRDARQQGARDELPARRPRRVGHAVRLPLRRDADRASLGNDCLTGRVLDQAQLHGYIERIEELGLELVSVEQMEPTQ